MIFHSFDFIIFFLVVLILYWTVNRRYQNIMLLVFSYFFYGYIHPWFLFLNATSTVTDYFCALGMSRYAKKKKRFLYISLVVNLGLLATFKYFVFFVANIKALLHGFGLSVINSVTIDIMLPVGISFYTFQTLGYTIDVYRGSIKPRRNYVNYALFVAFFPQLVAGPIERAFRLLILVYRGVEKVIPKFLKKTRWTIPFQVLLMFLLTHVGWLIFREQNLTQLIHDLTLTPFAGRRFDNKIAVYFFCLTFLYSLPIWFHSIYAWLREKVTLTRGDKYHRWFRYAAALCCYVLVIFFHTPRPVDFIYFQF